MCKTNSNAQKYHVNKMDNENGRKAYAHNNVRKCIFFESQCLLHRKTIVMSAKGNAINV